MSFWIALFLIFVFLIIKKLMKFAVGVVIASVILKILGFNILN